MERRRPGDRDGRREPGGRRGARRPRAAWSAVVLLAAACGKEASPPPADRAPDPPPARLRRFEIADPRSADLAFTALGAVELALFARGRGPLEVVIEEDGAPAAKSLLALSGEARSPAAVALPGAGTRALRVRVSAPAGTTLEEARVRDEEPRLPGAKRLAGALRGRSLMIVVCDALHARRLGSWGHERDTSPNVDALAREGVRFAAANAQSAWTLPSIATLFTGLEQERHGVRDYGRALDAELPTLAEAFQAAGHSTAAFVQNPVVSAPSGLARGFDRFTEYGRDAAARVPRDVRDHLAAAGAQPCFVYVHLLPPHAPYAPPRELATRFGRPTHEVDGHFAGIDRLAKAQPAADDPRVVQLAALYDNHVAWGDQLAGELFRAAAEHGRDRTVVLFLSDHGEAFAQHGDIGHERNVHDEIATIPLVLWAPGSPLTPGSVVREPVWMPDLLPSLAELFALDAGGEAHGQSFAGLLEGRDAGGARVLRLSAKYRVGTPDQRAIVFGRFKLVAPARKRPTALFDLEADPGETNDVSADHPVLAAALLGELVRWASEPLSESAAPGFVPDAKMRAALRELGYVDDGGK